MRSGWKFIAALAVLSLAALPALSWTHGSSTVVFPVTSGQNLLLRAQDIALTDGATITTWSDTSGSGNDLGTTSATKPTLALTGGNDAKPFVVFDTLTDMNIASTTYSVNKQAQSVLLVLDYSTLSVAKYTVTLGGGITYVFEHDTGIFKRFSGSFTNTTLTQVPSGKRVAILLTLGASATKLYVDASTNVQSLSAEASGTITGFQLGGSGQLTAKAYEVRGWNRELSGAEAAQILDTWAPAAYGTGSAATAPAGRVIFDGDSISAGVGATKARNWPYYLNPANGWLGHDYAVGGQQWSNLISRQAVTNNFANASNYLIVNCGANDTAAGRTGAQMETDFQTYIAAAVAAGFVKSKIFATTLNTQNPGTGTARNDYNTWIRANWPTYVGGLIDIAADTNLGLNEATNTPFNGVYWLDGVHYVDAGYVLYAAKVRSTIGSPLFYLLRRDIDRSLPANDNRPLNVDIAA